ncbi:MAG TPA: hypothetical protein VJ464_03350 [Blastocatellia bacterium]|nr:hypothetical protein [Blastocatellia bacterium]
MECLSEEVLDEFPEDALVWVILDKADPNTYLLFPKNKDVLALWAFMKREDANHLAFILKEAAPAYKDMELIVESDPLKEVRAGAKEYNSILCVMSPVDSLEFFKRYEEFLSHYYGTEISEEITSLGDLITADTALNELPDDTTIWIVYSEERNQLVIVPDQKYKTGTLWLFLKRQDAEHMAYLLMNHIPIMNGITLTVQERNLKETIDLFSADQQWMAIISPNKALEFFSRFKEYMAHYYGFTD